ncbi:MAG: transposase [Candidatus Aramenus sp.]|nr:transposase [Candidatus Aramenus sp.]
MNALATVVVESLLLYFTVVQQLRAITSIFQKKIAELDKLKSEAEKVQEQEAREEVLMERERVFAKLYRRLLHLQNFSISLG